MTSANPSFAAFDFGSSGVSTAFYLFIVLAKPAIEIHRCTYITCTAAAN
jgi:hypothetical protein